MKTRLGTFVLLIIVLGAKFRRLINLGNKIGIFLCILLFILVILFRKRELKNLYQHQFYQIAPRSWVSVHITVNLNIWYSILLKHLALLFFLFVYLDFMIRYLHKEPRSLLLIAEFLLKIKKVKSLRNNENISLHSFSLN